MKYNKSVILMLFSAAIFNFACASSKPPRDYAADAPAEISVMTNTEIDSLLALTSSGNMTVSERINFWSEKFLGMDFSWTATGDSPYALLEDWPLVNFQLTNCMVFCEHALALAISDSWDNFFNNLQQIRYKDGIIGMRTRNHYTMGDWLPENDWILEDISAHVGGGRARQVTRIISHENFFRGKGIRDLRYVLPDREITVDYIPLDRLDRIEDRLNKGDIAAILYADKTDIFSAHMLMIAEKNGKKYVREATTRGNTTFDTPYRDWTAAIQDSEQYIGLSFMRVRKELDIPGRVILPWEIPGLKKEVRKKQE